MNDLVMVKGNDVFTDSMVITKGTGVEHRKIKDRIKRYEIELGQFGLLTSYQAESSGGRPEKYYKLNEPQATLLMTLLKNTQQVVNFKVELVKRFYDMRMLLLERQGAQWQQIRSQGKVTRKMETDAIQDLVEYAREQGSGHPEMLYLTYSKLANKTAGINSRKVATGQQLGVLMVVEQIIINSITQGMNAGKYYKDIYQDCKKQMEVFSSMATLQRIA